MTRQGVSRFLLAVLAALIGGLVIRSCIEREAPDGLVSFTDGWDAEDLRHAAFRLDRPTTLAIEAVGSFEDDETLVAHGWIVRREDRAVVWEMTPESVRRGRGTLALAEEDVTLDPGTYDVYFSTFGNSTYFGGNADTFVEEIIRRLSRGKRAWESDKSKWALRINPASAADGRYVHRLEKKDDLNAAPIGPTLLWAGGPAYRGEYLSYGFELDRPTRLRIEATGEFLGSPADFGWIDDLSTGERIWTLTEENTEPAGGSRKNRRFEGTLDLAPGIYRAAYQTDGSHDVKSWNAAPPTDPGAYGLFLFTDEPERIASFDPWVRLPKIAQITEVGDDAMETATFTLSDSAQAWVYAVGELSDPGERYDYGWLVREGEGTVWEMEYDRTRNAGGASRNRVEEAYLALAPGMYTLHFESDDSHSPERWRGSKPYHPERWGVTLFALSRDFQPVTVDRQSEGERPASRIPAPLAAVGGEVELPILLAPLGVDQEVRRTFALDRETRLRIVAVGEIIRMDRYDYGWITDDRADDVVWEMTRSNTESAGGSRKNRRFEGTVTLPAGTYTVHFVTDDSHAYGDFSQGAPDDPEAWGITVERANGPTAPPPPPPQPVEASGVLDA